MSEALHLLVHQPALDYPWACLPAQGESNRNPGVTYKLLVIGCDVMRQPLLRGSIISSSRL